MRYAIARYNQHQRDLAYRIYVTDCLRISAECSTAHTGKIIKISRFFDLTSEKEKEVRTPEEIISNIKNKIKR